MNEDQRRQAKAEAQAAIDAASGELERGAISEADWNRRVTDALADAYLRDDDPRWQSGFDGDAELWRQARELILDAIAGDGTFLDVGCANAHLMECLSAWGLPRGRRLSMYGLELSPELASEARRRLPEWADRIFEGNVVDWQAPMRFTYVHTGLEYVPGDLGASLVKRVLRDLVEPGGRLIIGPVSEPEVDRVCGAVVDAVSREPTVVSATDRNGKVRYVIYVGD